MKEPHSYLTAHITKFPIQGDIITSEVNITSFCQRGNTMSLPQKQPSITCSTPTTGTAKAHFRPKRISCARYKKKERKSKMNV